MIYFGLCCLFKKENIKFKTYTKTALLKLSKEEQLKKVESVVLNNICSLQKALTYCFENNIKSYRFSSDLIPHFDFVTENNLLPDNYILLLKNINSYDIKISCHPGQYNNINSLNENVVLNSLSDLNYHYFINCLITKDIPEINIHLGGTFGDKNSAKERFINQIKLNKLNQFITIENDELSFSIDDCIEVFKKTNCRITMDLHHHNCYKLNKEYKPLLSDREYFLLAKESWIKNGFDYMRIHISSPRDGYFTPSKSRPHSDYIESIPEWLFEEAKHFDIYIDIEAKSKELAIFDLMKKYNT